MSAPAPVSQPDMSVMVGTLAFANPIMTASGTSGHGSELAPYGDLARLGAVVVKSLAPYEWAGNPAPRVHPTPQGMINAVGLQGAGVQRWIHEELPALAATGARVVLSIWGRSVADYAAAAEQVPELVLELFVLAGREGALGEGHDTRERKADRGRGGGTNQAASGEAEEGAGGDDRLHCWSYSA